MSIVGRIRKEIILFNSVEGDLPTTAPAPDAAGQVAQPGDEESEAIRNAEQLLDRYKEI